MLNLPGAMTLAQAVPAMMDDAAENPAWTEAFVTSITTTLRDLAGVEAAPLGAEAAVEPRADVTARIRLSGTRQGELVLCLPTATATALAERVLAGAAAVDPAMVLDCMGELANVIAGQAKTLLYGTPDHFMLSPPTVTAGDAGPIPADDACVRFGSEVGEFVAHFRRAV
jgi:chemotaxis protein CheX